MVQNLYKNLTPGFKNHMSNLDNFRQTLGTQMGYSVGVPTWLLQKTNLSELLTILLRLSIIKPISNQITKNHLGPEFKTSQKMNKDIKTKLTLRIFERPLSMWKPYVIRKKILTAQ